MANMLQVTTRLVDSFNTARTLVHQGERYSRVPRLSDTRRTL